MQANRFNEFPILKQLGLVLDVIARYPGLYLVSHTLELLDLGLQVCLELLLLRLVCRGLHFVVYTFE